MAACRHEGAVHLGQHRHVLDVPRAEWRRVVGALCVVLICVGALALLPPVEFPVVGAWLRPRADAVWHWLNSRAGLLTLSATSVALQLAGVVLVVQDLRRHTRNLQLLGQVQRNIHGVFINVVRERDTLYADQLGRMEEQTRATWGASPGSALERVQESFVGIMGGAAELTRMLERAQLQLRRAELLVQSLSLHANEIRDPRKWVTWLGPALLLVGIVSGGAATLLGIDA